MRHLGFFLQARNYAMIDRDRAAAARPSCMFKREMTMPRINPSRIFDFLVAHGAHPKNQPT
jgi:hypothetical protein